MEAEVKKSAVFLSPETVAERLELDPGVVRRWIREGKIKASKLGRLWRVKESDFEAFAEKGFVNEVE
jgi:excisionase family DNA binding protein